MSDAEEWESYISRIKKAGAGTYGTSQFMCAKHEHWKFIYASEKIAELERLQTLLLRQARDSAKILDALLVIKEALRGVENE